MTASCEICGREFDSEFGVSQHRAQMHTEQLPWHDEEQLRELYHGKRMSSTEIAEKYGLSRTTIKEALKRFGIERRSRSEAKKLSANKKPVHHRTTRKGYEVWITQHMGEYQSVVVHRLVAIAEHGFDAVDGMVVHHKNGIPWDNRHENLEPMAHEEHVSHHHERGDYDRRNNDEEWLNQLSDRAKNRERENGSFR